MAQILICEECGERFDKPFLQIAYGQAVEHYHVECMVWHELWGKLGNYASTLTGGNHLEITVLVPPEYLEKVKNESA